ncbi:MAG: flagellar hook protein FlgE [Micavibrio sp.]|nr:flagellar hook protein FlgE [Micavibrio sp.]
MSLTSALYTAVSALQAQSAAISSVSQNIANASTTAYKTTGVSFQDLVTGTGNATTGNVSGGVLYSTYQNMSAQGTIQATDSNTDLAINGDGFFVVTNSDTSSTAPDYTYSRNGSFTTDANGYLVNSEGYYLMGQATDASGNVTSGSASSLNSLTQVNTNIVSGMAQATANVTMAANLPADAAVGDTFNTSFEIYDSLGVSSTVNQTWTKTGANEWSLAMADPVLTSDNTTTSGTISPASATLTFNGDGSLASTDPATLDVTVSGFSTGASDDTFKLNLGTAGSTTGLTQYASNSSDPQIDISSINQDGLKYGQLTNVTVGKDGIVTANFDNGLSRAIYQIPIATFANANGLTHVNGSIYDENEAAGNVTLHDPGEGSAGSITASALEASTVDTSSEFSRMIVAQQAYSSAAQVVTTAKDMYDTLISMVR